MIEFNCPGVDKEKLYIKHEEIKKARFSTKNLASN
jgi:hypothetical protein